MKEASKIFDETAIDIQNISKVYKVKEKSSGNLFKRLFGPSSFKEIVAIDDLSLKISKGEFVGLVGNNGAGKSTLVKMMTGILYNTSGKISILGKDPYKNRLENNKKMSVVFGQRTQLRWDLSALDSFNLLKIIYDIDEKTYDDNLERFIDLFEMESFIKQPVRTLSLGQKMKCEITAAFLHNPEIVLLDEPTIGLDIFSQDAIIEFLKEVKEDRKTTILLTTHDMNEIGQACERVVFLDEGKIIVDDVMENLMDLNISKRDVSVLTYNKTPVELSYDFGLNIVYSDYKIDIKQVESERLLQVITAIMKKNQIKDITIEKENFTDIVKKIYEVNG